MYLTMNRFKVHPPQADAFEALWLRRDSHLKEVPGFLSFHLMRGPEREAYVLYASHTAWETEEAFAEARLQSVTSAATPVASGAVRVG